MMGNTAGHLYSSVFLVMLILGVLVFFANECIVHFIILRIRKKTGKSRDEAYLEFCKGRDERRQRRHELLARGSEPVHMTPTSHTARPTSEAKTRRKNGRCACGLELTSREAAQAMCAICQVNGYQIDCPFCGETIQPGLLLCTGSPIYKKCPKCEVSS